YNNHYNNPKYHHQHDDYDNHDNAEAYDYDNDYRAPATVPAAAAHTTCTYSCTGENR
ncbi:jg636, partial [Pararge aegeria aegeria]